ncbi:MAG: hypothetical protein M0T75_03425 [Chloroflexi bacterium]|nr:hypothetical protein [Chloroflexota bacterium]
MTDATHLDHPAAQEPDEGRHGHAGHDEDGEHAEPLGPVDWAAWGAGLLGIAAGLVVAFCLFVATSL